MYEPKISVIIPVYNVEKYISKCLQSVILQTYTNLEIICINDGSTDNSLEIMENFAEKDKRIKIISRSNKGQSYARNLGLDTAAGDYVSFIDADDWISLTLYSEFVEAVNNFCFDIFMFNGTEVYEKPKSSYYPTFFKSDFFTDKDYAEKICSIYDFSFPFLYNLSVANKIYRTEFLRQNDFKFLENKKFEDELFNFKTMIKANGIKILNEVLYFYRKDNLTSTTNLIEKNIFDRFDIIDDLENFILDNGLEKEFNYPIFQYKYYQLTKTFCRCSFKDKFRFYDKMKETVLSRRLGEISEDYCKNFDNFSIYQAVKNHGCLYYLLNYYLKQVIILRRGQVENGTFIKI